MEFRVAALLTHIEKQSKLTLLLICGCLILIVGVMDMWTGIELSFALFYLIPVSLAAWGLGQNISLVIALTSALMWCKANYLVDNGVHTPLIFFWNTVSRLLIFSAVAILISTIRHLLHQERRLSRTDNLTGGLNRRGFYEAIGTEMARNYRNPLPFAVLYIDLDHFKLVNDRWGHSTGDQVLREVMAVLMAHCRGGDIPGRLGGDEFAILLPDASRWQTKAIAHRLNTILLETMQAHGWPVTFSIGVLWCSKTQESLETLIQEADQMMYLAKQAGRNTIQYADL